MSKEIFVFTSYHLTVVTVSWVNVIVAKSRLMYFATTLIPREFSNKYSAPVIIFFLWDKLVRLIGKFWIKQLSVNVKLVTFE